MIDWDRIVTLLMTYGVPGIITLYIAMKQYEQHRVEQTRLVAVDTQADLLVQYKRVIVERDDARKAYEEEHVKALEYERKMAVVREVVGDEVFAEIERAWERRHRPRK